jgi:Tol biopolymer transport system component
MKHYTSNKPQFFFFLILFIICCEFLAACQSDSIPTEAIPSAQNLSAKPTSTIFPTNTPKPTLQTTTATSSITVLPSATVIPTKNDPIIPTATPSATPSPIHFQSQGFLLYGISNINEESQIYALQAGGTSHFITTGQLLSGQAFSPDSTKIIVDTNDWSNPPLSPEKVFIFDLKTGELMPLNLLAHPRSGIFWSEDGASLLYIDKYSEDASDQLVLYDIASGENKILAEVDSILHSAGWSVDNQTIAFVAQVDGQYDLFTVNSETFAQEQLTDNPDIETMVLWSPVAPQLLVGTVLDERSAFESWPWGVESLFLLDIDNDNWQLFIHKWLGSESASWSPDGQQIVYSDAGLLCIKNTKTLVEFCPLADTSPHNEYFASFWEPPVWSVDGTWLAFRAYNETCHMVYFLELHTNLVVPSDLGCDITFGSPIAPIYWMPANLPESLN